MNQETNAFFQKWGKLLMFAACVLFFAYVGWNTPLTGDDMEFASLQYDTLGEYWTYVSQYGNGRFLGNALAVAMPYLPLLRIWGKAVVLASCVMLLPRVLGMDSLMDCCLSFLLFVGVDGELFGEVYSWGAGFSNYITPIWLTLLILDVLNLETGPLSRSGAKVLIVFPLAVCAQLFMEHSSGVNLLLAMYATVRGIRKKGRFCLGTWAWLAGSLLGLAVMLLGPRLFFVSGNHMENYRDLYLGSFWEALTACIRNSLKLSTYYLNTNALPICLGCAATLWLTRLSRSHRANQMMALIWGVCTGYIAFCALHGLGNYAGKLNSLYHVVGLVVILVLIPIWALAAWQLGRGDLREKLLLCVAFGVIPLAPLLIVHPVPERVVIQSYIFFAAAGMLSLVALGKTLEPRTFRWCKSAALIMAAVSLLNLLFIYTFIGRVSKLREDYILEQIDQGADTIQVFTFEYDYVFDDSLDGLTIQYYSKLAGYPVTFERVSQSQWLQWYG